MAAEGLVVAEGALLVERLLSSELELLGLLCLPSQEARWNHHVKGRCPVESLPRTEMAALAGFPFHRGVLAAARRPEDRGVRDFFDDHPSTSRLVILPRLGDPANLGSLMRSAAALGYEGLWYGRVGADPWCRRALRASMGAGFALPLAAFDHVSEVRDTLKQGQYALWATGPRGGVSPDELVLPKRLALAFGHEGDGLEEAWFAWADAVMTLPQTPGPDSLGVAAAGAVCLWACRHTGSSATFRSSPQL